MYSPLFNPISIAFILQRTPRRTAVNEGREQSRLLARRRPPARAPRPNRRPKQRCTGGPVSKRIVRILLRLARNFGFGRQNPFPATIYAFSRVFSNPNPPLCSLKMSTPAATTEGKAPALARKKKGTTAVAMTAITGGSHHHAAAAPFPIGRGRGAAAATAPSAGFGTAPATSSMARFGTTAADSSPICGTSFTGDSSHARGGATGASPVWWDAADGASPISPAFRRSATWDGYGTLYTCLSSSIFFLSKNRSEVELPFFRSSLILVQQDCSALFPCLQNTVRFCSL